MVKNIKAGIYKITNSINGKFYIGSSVDLDLRKSSHFSRLSKRKHSNPILQNSYNKYGESSFVFEILEAVEEKIKLIEREQYYLDTLRPFNDIGYNICTLATSQLGVKRSQEFKDKISKANKGNICSDATRKKLSIAGKGRKMSKEFCENLSKRRKGIRVFLEPKQTADHIEKRRLSCAKTVRKKQFIFNKSNVCDPI